MKSPDASSPSREEVEIRQGDGLVVGEISYDGESKTEVIKRVKWGTRSWRKWRVVGVAAGAPARVISDRRYCI